MRVHTWTLMVAAITAGASCSAPARSARLVGQVAPDFVATSPDGSTFQLSSLRGRIVVLDLWASWCDGCEEELPILDNLARRIAPLGAKVVSVAIDEDASQPLRILRRRAWSMTVLYEASGALGDVYAPAKMPMVLVIDADGFVRDQKYALTETDIHDLEQRVKALSARSSTGGTR